MLPAAAPIAKLDWKTTSCEAIAKALATSDEAMVPKFFGHSVAHEAHHRSQIEIALRLGEHEIPEVAMFAL